jgi:hypothetical protein
MLSKRLRTPSVKNDEFWERQQNLNLQKFIFEERWSREEWRRIQASHGIKTKEADAHYGLYCTMEHWLSDEYWVVLDKECKRALYQTFQGYPLWHIEIRRRDGQPIRDWQIIQAIKNQVVGKEYEAVELYPAHYRLMDTCNKYHLWVLAPKEVTERPPRFPLGCKQFGAISDTKMICSERLIQAYHTEMSEKQREDFRKTAQLVDMLIFPDALRGEAEKEFPGVEYVQAMSQ